MLSLPSCTSPGSASSFSPKRHHSKPWTCLLPAYQHLTYHTFHHPTLERLVTLPIFPGACLLSSFCLVHKQQESESHSSFDHCCPGLGTWLAERALEKLQKETSSPSLIFPPPHFSPADPRACGGISCSLLCLSVLSVLPVSVHALSPITG